MVVQSTDQWNQGVPVHPLLREWVNVWSLIKFRAVTAWIGSAKVINKDNSSKTLGKCVTLKADIFCYRY